jgi:Photosystem I psaA/psaB protein/LAGLIDADG endonuclease
MYFHGARFSNYEAWLSDPTHIKPSAQVVWPVVGQEILNGDVGGGFQGIQITSGFFQLWRASGITSELQLYTTAIGGLVLAGAMFFAGWFHYHKAAPKLEWFQNVESMMNHHLGGLLGLGSLGWAGHQIHVSLPINKLLDAGVDPKEIPLPHELLLNKNIIADLYPSFAKGLAPFFTLDWAAYGDFLTFKGGLNPVTGGLWLSDTAHHHLAIAVLFLVAGHQYRTNWSIGHSMKEILEAHKGPFTGEGHVGLYEILTTSWHAQLAINLALFGSLSIIVAYFLWVTLNPTICWNIPFLMFKRMPKVLVQTFLSVFSILLECQQTLVEMVSKKFKVGQWENLLGRNNQQETQKNRGSSETLRGTFIFSNKKNNSFLYDFSNFQKFSEKHKKLSSSKRKFLEWFLGFSEGDGSFGIQDGRPVFVINQAEIEILQKIRAELGFGVVFTYQQEGSIYARYLVTKKEAILCLIHLFNGNIHLQKVQNRFTAWVQKYNENFCKENGRIQIQPRRLPTQISLENAWLSGFFDAEGGFFAGISKQTLNQKHIRLRLNAYVDQKNELDVLQQIAFLFGVFNVTTRSSTKQTYRVECSTKKSLRNVLLYFETYNLRSKKHLVYAMWRKIVYSYLEKSHFENLEQLKRRIFRIQKQNQIFKELKTVLPK